MLKEKIKRTLKKHGLMYTPPNKLDDMLYTPRWRWNNYIAVREFGESHKRWMIEQRYAWNLGEFPNLDHPRKFNEKIHWLSLNYQDARITRCCDKLEMKQYVTEKIGPGHVVPVIRTYDKAADVNFDELPEKFAIKVNWGDGTEYSELVTSKSHVDVTKLKVKLNNAMQPWNNVYYSHFFWGYKNVKPQIFVEEYIEHPGTDLTDYKVHCFNGKPKFVLVCEERSMKTKMKKTFLDLDWNIMPCHRMDGEVNPDVVKPQNFDEMLRISELLSEPFPFLRVDFYCVEGKLYIGELTFHPGCGFESFYPEEWNTKVGDMLTLPPRTIIDKDERA